MAHQEIEIKILEIDVAKVISTLNALKANKIFDGKIFADFFKNKDGIKLRIRRIDGKNIMTFKKPISSAGIRHNEEIEISFDDYDGMVQLLAQLGFEHYGSSEKQRITYQLDETLFEIDTLPQIPTFLEIEAASVEELKEGVKLMGYSMDQTSSLTERTIKEHYGVKQE